MKERETGSSVLLFVGFMMVSAILLLDGCAQSQNAPASGSSGGATVKPYALKTCVVSGEELGKMGEVKRIVFEGQEIKFCCPGCEKDFRKDPKKFLKIMVDAGK